MRSKSYFRFPDKATRMRAQGKARLRASGGGAGGETLSFSRISRFLSDRPPPQNSEPRAQSLDVALLVRAVTRDYLLEVQTDAFYRGEAPMHEASLLLMRRGCGPRESEVLVCVRFGLLFASIL